MPKKVKAAAVEIPQNEVLTAIEQTKSEYVTPEILG
jgi:hypothetical protein